MNSNKKTNLKNEIKNSFLKIEELFKTDTKHYSIIHFIYFPEHKLEMYNITLGKWIRESLLFENTDLIMRFWEQDIYDPYQMSFIIIKEFYDELQHKKTQ